MTTTGIFNVYDCGAAGDGAINDYDALAEVLSVAGALSHDAADVGGVIWPRVETVILNRRAQPT